MGDDYGQKLKVFAAGSIGVAAGVSSFLKQSGDFNNTVANTGPGDISVTLLGGGIDANECFVVATPRAAQAASGLTSIGCVHTSDTVKQFTTVQEAAMGGASTRVSVPFDFVIFAFGED